MILKKILNFSEGFSKNEPSPINRYKLTREGPQSICFGKKGCAKESLRVEPKMFKFSNDEFDVCLQKLSVTLHPIASFALIPFHQNVFTNT